MTDNTEVSSNGMVFPKDETTPWGTDGVRAYWQAEATAATATKPKFGTQALRLHKLMALTPVTDELLADSSAIEGYLSNLFARSIRWKTNEALLLGTGAGQPMGAFTNAGNTGSCAVVQAKDSGQATLTVTVGNVTNMIARLPPGSYGRAVWLITPDALPLVFQLTLGSYPIWMPTGSPTVGGVQLNPVRQSARPSDHRQPALAGVHVAGRYLARRHELLPHDHACGHGRDADRFVDASVLRCRRDCIPRAVPD
jgi:HK97 family phage major capsid protein